MLNVSTYSGPAVQGFWDSAANTFDETSASPNATLVRAGEIRRLSTTTTDAELQKRVEGLPPASSQAAMLSFTYGTSSNQVQMYDQVYRSDTKTFWAFKGASQANAADITFWSELDAPVVPGGGRYINDSATYAGLPSSFKGGELLIGDKAYLTADDGTYKRGWVEWNGLIWLQLRAESATTSTSQTESVTLATLPAEAWTVVNGTTVTAPKSAFVSDSAGVNVTNTVLVRLNAGKIELRSSVAMSSLTVTLVA
jgi:hypothetical protein